MTTLYLFYNNSIFSLKSSEAKSEPYSVGVVHINLSDGYIGCKINVPQWMCMDNALKVGNCLVRTCIHGRIWHQYGFGEIWEFILEITNMDSNPLFEFEKLKFSGSAYTKDFEAKSIGNSLIRALNEIHRFESVQDCIDYQITKDTTKHELEDEIVNLSKVILLCKKYEEINPVFPYHKNIKDWIEKHLSSLINISKKDL